MSTTLRNAIFAAALALFGIILTSSYIKGQKASIVKGSERVTVLVAKKDIPAGTKASALQEGGFIEEREVARRDQTPEALGSLKGVEKLALNGNVYQGGQLTARHFEATSNLNTEDQIKGTERAITVPFTPAEALGGLVQPGDRVDLMAARNYDSGSGRVTEQFVVARNVYIMQTPESLTQKGGEGEATAPKEPVKANDEAQLYTLKATDKQAQNIMWAFNVSEETRVWMILRPSAGDQESQLAPQTAPQKVA